ncbi:MAG: DUF3566 domain-containing protein [Acidimicrobiales bacterium]
MSRVDLPNDLGAPAARVEGPRRPPRPPRPDRRDRRDRTVDSAGDRSAEPTDDRDGSQSIERPPEVTTATLVAPAPFTSTMAPDPADAEVPSRPPAKSRPGVRRGRRVRRIVRRIDLWSVLKLSLMVYTCVYAAVLATLAALWGLAYSTGSIDKLESFLSDVGLENFHFYGDQMFRACAAIGAVGVIAGTVITVLAIALVNLVSEMTGGIRLVVIEEDVAA